jgi:hypothetical protein
MVSWTTGVKQERFIFTGGIIFTMNSPLDNNPALRAVKTRISHLDFCPPQAEVKARMKEVALIGFRHPDCELTPGQCYEVFEFCVNECATLNRNLDLRSMVKGFSFRVQAEAGKSVLDWQDMFRAFLTERVQTGYVSRASRVESERAIAVEINALPIPTSEKLVIWKERTGGKSKDAFYRRLKG